MEIYSNEKLHITDKDALRRRHSGDYKAVSNGEVYSFDYEESLKDKDEAFFNRLSDYDFLKDTSELASPLTMKDLKEALKGLDDTEHGADFLKNFLDHSLKKYLNIILRPNNWRDYLKKANETIEEKPFNDDILRCVYLLAHLHKASPTYLRELSKLNCIWSTDLRVYYPRKDMALSAEYGAYMAELFVNILYRQPSGVRKVIKSLDIIIDKLVEYNNTPFVQSILRYRSEAIDPPSLRILKHYQIASITHNAALNDYLAKYVTESFSSSSVKALEALIGSSDVKIVATAKDYKLVAAMGVKLMLGGNAIKLIDDRIIEGCNIAYRALAADAILGLKFGSERTKDGKRDTSLASAIKIMARQNPQTVKSILMADSLDMSNIPEIYTTYVKCRVHYAWLLIHDMFNVLPFVQKMESNPKIDEVVAYINGNNIDKIYEDMELMDSSLKENNHKPDAEGLYCYRCRELPSR